ncbi:MAG: carcinine hydrolase/isopenicillin-N N-acyltransferase family protein [Candidatus Aminicenantes bacterium]
MRNFKTLSVFLIVTIVFIVLPAWPCTVAVISGKATPDGRPLLWKNRDTGTPYNHVIYIQGEKYDFIGIANSSDAYGNSIWSGVNSAGLCIMNSMSYNINTGADKNKTPHSSLGNGRLMRLALEQCATVEEFEAFLKETEGKRNVDSNFGVIDAQGGASFFETGNHSHVRLDAGDPEMAPEGYIVRTNFSYTGAPRTGAGYIRFNRISKLFLEASATGGITHNWILISASRDMVNSLTGIDPLRGKLPAHSRDHRYFHMADSIARNTAISTTVFHGVKKDEDPAAVTMWTRVGHPLCSVALPLWVCGGEKLGITYGEPHAPIERFADYWHKRIFPLSGGSRDRYLNLAPVINKNGTGILTRLISIEQDILHATETNLKGKPRSQELLVKTQLMMQEKAVKLLFRNFPRASQAAGF